MYDTVMVITGYVHRGKGFKLNSSTSTLHLRYGWDPRTKVMACAALFVFEGICNKMMLHFYIYCKYGVLVFGDDWTGPANESKRTKCVQGWSRQIMETGFCYLQYYYFVK